MDAGEPLGGAQCELLVSPPQAAASQVDDGFAAGEEGKRLGRILVASQDSGQEAAGLPGLAVQLIGEKNRLISQIPAYALRSPTQFPHTADNMGRYVG